MGVKNVVFIIVVSRVDTDFPQMSLPSSHLEYITGVDILKRVEMYFRNSLKIKAIIKQKYYEVR